MQNIKNWAVELSEQTGKSTKTIYAIAQKLGRKPTIDDVKTVKRGRPAKY